MHSLHLVAVTASSEDDAIARALGWLDECTDPWFDWFELGGRWDGCLAGRNVLCVAEDAVAAEEMLLSVAGRQEETFAEGLRRVSGSVFSEDDVPAQMSGVPVANRALAADALSRDVAESSRLWDVLVSSGSLSGLRAEGMFSPTWFLLWRLMRTLELGLDRWNSDSGFVALHDDEAVSVNPLPLLQLLRTGDAGSWYLVAVDFHH